jgi:hypothetical protein
MAVNQEDKIVILNRAALLIIFPERRACQVHSEAPRKGLGPLLISHFPTVRCEPGDVLDTESLDGAALKELSAVKYRVVLSDLKQSAYEIE